MARKSFGVSTLIKVVKAVDRAQKQSARERERNAREQERARNHRIRQLEKITRAQEKERVQSAREKIKLENKAIKDEIQFSKGCYEARIEERRIAKEEIINKFMR